MLKQLKLQFDLYKNDTFAIVKLTLLLIVVLFGVRSIPTLVDKITSRKLSHQTSGTIIEIEPDKYIREALEGGKVVTKGYSVQFEYTIDNQIFNTENYIDKSILSVQEKAKIYNAKAGDTIIVKYNPEKPQFSKLKLP